ncbi:MAG TPA: phytochelatin synthase family protein, partial [Myxococcales bacterium]|nr:phytochelatin synthase family protein [Myxococcales bacterium]
MLLLLLAQLQALPPQLIALDSDEGRKLLVESAASRDFYSLVGTFQQQESQPLCGVASSATVLNAMPLQAPEV